MIKCPKCGKKMKLKKLAEYDAADLLGLTAVIVRGMPAFVCTKCDEVMIPGDILDSISRHLVRELLVGSFPFGGVEIKFLRKKARLTQQMLADLLGVDRVTVARWEGLETTVPAPVSPAVRMVMLAHDLVPGLELPRENFRRPPAERPSEFYIDSPGVSTPPPPSACA